ncbi:MAG: nitronate monooxygenase [Myxococcota bacterium]
MQKDPLRTPVCDLLDVSLPIVCFTHCREVAVAATRAGCFAVLGEALRSSHEIETDVRWIREQVGDNFGVDLVLPSGTSRADTPDQIYSQIPDSHIQFAERIEEEFDVPAPSNEVVLRNWGGNNQMIAREQIEMALDQRVPVIATGLGAPDFLFREARDRRVKLISLVGTTRQALRQVGRGADVVVAQGYDAAGHTGGVGTFSIVPEIAAKLPGVPVLAAGGITSGRHLAAALCLGAAGVWTGTVWLTSSESDVDPLIKRRILGADGSETTRSPSLSGKTMRVLTCPWTEVWERDDAPSPLESPYQMMLTSRYLQGANDARRPDLMTEAVGQGVYFVNQERPVAEVVEHLASDARRVLWELVGR